MAPDENGKDATVRLSSKSNRGIGTLVLTFHTETLKLQVDISGTQNVADFLPSTLTITSIVLTKRPDGSFEGTGTSNMVGSVGPCSPAFTETGAIGLTATRAAAPDGTTSGEWSVVSERIPSNSDVKFNCEGETIGATSRRWATPTTSPRPRDDDGARRGRHAYAAQGKHVGCARCDGRHHGHHRQRLTRIRIW